MGRGKIEMDVIASAIGAKAHFDVWWTLTSEARLRFKDVMNGYPDFFNSTHDAHYIAFFICFAQLFDKRRDASSLATFLGLRKAELAADEFNRFVAERSALEARAKPLLEIRHNLIAHLNAMHTEITLFSTLDATWNGMRQTIYDTATFTAALVGGPDPGQIGIPRDGRLNEATIRLLQSLGNESDA